jgi:hypothetical protein
LSLPEPDKKYKNNMNRINKSHAVPNGTGTGSEGTVFSTNILSLTGQRAMFLLKRREVKIKNKSNEVL